MSHSSHLKLFALTALLAFAVKAQAQTHTTPSPETTSWSKFSETTLDRPLEVITVAEPTVRHKCTVKKITADHIECGRHLHSSMIYTRDQIQTVLAPAYKPSAWVSILIGEGIAGGIVTGACFLAMLGPVGIVAAVPVGLIGVMFGLFVVAYDDSGPEPERFLYLRPTTSTITLTTVN